MLWLGQFGFKTGFSDHSATFEEDGNRINLRNLPSKVAIYLGATVLERHFTNLNPSETKDGRISILKDDLADLKNFSNLNKLEQSKYLQNYPKEMNLILGFDNYEPSVEEWYNRSYYQGRVK
jgi:sialic acid synthase SpsE